MIHVFSKKFGEWIDDVQNRHGHLNVHQVVVVHTRDVQLLEEIL